MLWYILFEVFGEAVANLNVVHFEGFVGQLYIAEKFTDIDSEYF